MQTHRSLFERLQRFGRIDDFSCFFTARAAFCKFLLQCSSKRQNMVVFSESCKLTISMTFRAFSRDDALFCYFFLESSSKGKRHCSLFQKFQRFGQINDFFVLFHEMRLAFATFSRKVDRNAKTWQFVRKSCIVLAKSMISRAFPRNEAPLQLLAEKFMKMPRHGSLLEKLKVLAKTMLFRAFSRNEALFATFS